MPARARLRRVTPERPQPGAGHGLAGGALRAPRLLASLAEHALATQPRAGLQGLGDCVFFAQTAPGSGGPALRCPGCARLRWGRCGIVGPPCSSAWPPCSPKVRGRRATSGLGTNFAGSVCVARGGWDRGRGCVECARVWACARSVQPPRSAEAPLRQVPHRRNWRGRPSVRPQRDSRDVSLVHRKGLE